MLKDHATLNAKGHVKLELYNEGGVFYTKEKKNLVVQSANEIVAGMMADPAKVLRVHQADKGDSALTANAEQLYPFALTVKHEAKEKFENNWGASNATTDFTIAELKGITSLDKVLVDEEELLLDQDVFLIDAEQGSIRFAEAPKGLVTIHFHKVNNPYMKMIAGTERVKVAGEAWKRAAVADHAAKTYQVNPRTGHILFQMPVTLVEVEYDYHMNYSLGFMALGGKPNAAHPNYQPVEFGNSNKLDTFMHNELADSRMPVHYPAAISNGATELEPAIPTQPIATVQKTAEVTVTDIGDGETKKVAYDLPNLHDSGTGLTGRVLHEVVSVHNATTEADILENAVVSKNGFARVEITFADADITIGDTIHVVYRLKLDNRHLIYQLGQSPVVKLVSVRHIDAVDPTNIQEYSIIDGGLRINQGDVWISNPNTGHITFSAEPTGGPAVHTPGQLQVEYMVNSGTMVKFVADFPKGHPAPTVEDAPAKIVNIVSGQTSVALDHAIAKEANGTFIEPEVVVNGTALSASDYQISVDGRTLTPNALNAGDTVAVNYKYLKETHDIYQVAMFDDKVNGKMFNISGIGPVTKDKNTGMRVTWSVTF